MPDIFDIDPLEKFMCLMVGPNGSGKSIAIASWMAKGSIYYFDFDGRMASVANWYRQRGLQQGQLVYDTYGPDNIYDAITQLREWVTGTCPHAAIVIDSFTAVTVSAVTFQMYRRMGKGAAHAVKTTKGDLPVPDWDEFNGEAMYVQMLLDACKQLAAKGVCVFWTAHPVQRMNITQSGSKQTIIYQTKYAAFGHKSDSLVPIYFNEIYNMHVEQDGDTVRRICQTQPADGIAAKTALNIPVKIDWTNQNFYELFTKAVKEGVNKLNNPPTI